MRYTVKGPFGPHSWRVATFTFVFALNLAACTTSPTSTECVEGRIVSCPCPARPDGTQTCRAGVFEACRCAEPEIPDGGMQDAAPRDGGQRDAADSGAGLAAGDPCVPATLTPAAPPTDGRCVPAGALVCDPETGRMVLEPCLFDDVCVETRITQIGHSPRPGVTIPEVTYTWAQCVVDATPRCTFAPDFSEWAPVDDYVFACDDDTRRAECVPVQPLRLPYNAGAAQGYLLGASCFGEERCDDGRCILGVECELGESFCDSGRVYNCTEHGARPSVPVEGGVCRETTACTNEGQRTATYVVPSEGVTRCNPATFAPACDTGGAELLCQQNCYGAESCECDVSFRRCGDDLRCAVGRDGSTFCEPDIDCDTDADFCDEGRAVDCAGERPSVAYCALYGSVCSLVEGRAVCAGGDACPSEPTCEGNSVVACCPGEGRYALSTGVDLPCTPGTPVRLTCRGANRCVEGDCLFDAE